MSNKNLPIVLGLLGVGIITLVGGGWYFRQTAKEWVRESQAYDEADIEEQREKRARLEKQVEEDYDPNYADEEGLFGSSSGDSDEKISGLWAANDYNDRDSFSDKGGSKKNRKPKKSVSKRRQREKSNKNQKNTKKMSKRNRSKRRNKIK
jgi:hypothetical protein